MENDPAFREVLPVCANRVAISSSLMSCTMIYWGRSVEKFYSVFKDFEAVADICILQNQTAEIQCDLLDMEKLNEVLIGLRMISLTL